MLKIIDHLITPLSRETELREAHCGRGFLG